MIIIIIIDLNLINARVGKYTSPTRMRINNSHLPTTFDKHAKSMIDLL